MASIGGCGGAGATHRRRRQPTSGEPLKFHETLARKLQRRDLHHTAKIHAWFNDVVVGLRSLSCAIGRCFFLVPSWVLH
jgi:hypothetical protein